VDADGNPVPYGQLSHKVFLTNLSNFTQPLIRYEITDRVILREGKECGCGDERLWIDVEGRSPVLLQFTDENNKQIDISSISISMEMHKVCEKTELYQFILH
jgi:phenylacetate-coenzyme A ligase PaaK-like adenylate-forming protein